LGAGNFLNDQGGSFNTFAFNGSSNTITIASGATGYNVTYNGSSNSLVISGTSGGEDATSAVTINTTLTGKTITDSAGTISCSPGCTATQTAADSDVFTVS